MSFLFGLVDQTMKSLVEFNASVGHEASERYCLPNYTYAVLKPNDCCTYNPVITIYQA